MQISVTGHSIGEATLETEAMGNLQNLGGEGGGPFT